jgi:hypothetical protein
MEGREMMPTVIPDARRNAHNIWNGRRIWLTALGPVWLQGGATLGVKAEKLPQSPAGKRGLRRHGEAVLVKVFVTPGTMERIGKLQEREAFLRASDAARFALVQGLKAQGV